VHALDSYPPRLPRDLGQFVAAPEALASLVATFNSQVVAHVCVSRSSAPESLGLAQQALGVQREDIAVIAGMLISSTTRRRGVARALLTEACQRCAAGCGALRHADGAHR